MPFAVVYARFSPRPSAEECDSVEKQIERCRAYCAGHGYRVAAAFHDKDLSGGRADNRPGLQDAIAAARSKKAVLVVYSLDRLARNTRDAIDILDQLRRGGADLASITESLNTRSAIGQFLFELLAAFAQLQRRQIQERTSSAMRHQGVLLSRQHLILNTVSDSLATECVALAKVCWKHLGRIP